MPWPSAVDFLAPLAPWFDGARRELPWRALDLDAPHADPYAVLVSELMLQQTQVATVVPYFLRWLDRFPTPQALAAANEDAVHKAWEGLGYYRRARFLKAAATVVAARGWPTDLAGLTELPGLGPYTPSPSSGPRPPWTATPFGSWPGCCWSRASPASGPRSCGSGWCRPCAPTARRA